jgi:hypothetical protein
MDVAMRLLGTPSINLQLRMYWGFRAAHQLRGTKQAV